MLFPFAPAKDLNSGPKGHKDDNVYAGINPRPTLKTSFSAASSANLYTVSTVCFCCIEGLVGAFDKRPRIVLAGLVPGNAQEIGRAHV